MKMAFGMSGVICVTLVSALFGVTTAREDTIFSGFLGCRFSRAVCRKHEECVDDHLFGNCQDRFAAKDWYQYDMGERQLQTLEAEIGRLILMGSTWNDLYTQCTLGNILLSFRTDSDYDPEFCDDGGSTYAKPGSSPDALSANVVNLLENYLEGYYGDGGRDFLSQLDNAGEDIPRQMLAQEPLWQEEESYYPSSLEKKNEIVTIHKYLKSDKRDPDLFSAGLQDGGDREYPIVEEVDSGNRDYYDYLDSLSPNDLQLLQDFLDSKETESTEPPYQMEDSNPAENDREVSDWLGTDVPEDMEADPSDISDVEESKTLPMTPEDAKLLGDLLEGGIKVSDLSDEQIDRLTQYVDSMLDSMGSRDGTGKEESPLGVAAALRQQAAPSVVKKEQTNAELLASPPGNAVVHASHGQPNPYPHPGHSRQAPLVAPGDSGGPAELPEFFHHDHSFDSSMQPVPTKGFDLVNPNYLDIQVEPETDDVADATLILSDLQVALQLPADTFSDLSVDSGEINFRVNPNSRGLNASGMSALILHHVDEIQNHTGFRIVKADIGSYHGAKVNVANVASNEPKFFVLTFVLCGVIAGIVLAVITIYVVRRHLVSREKLAQLAGTTENAEASKDYQDLCRQRMQSKSSEKPEPLHVASRMGSVSATEAAVRSPSSRSSTSSWSEEPVASNMDISTGHIVLAYMEDHLKNKERLNEEWEALVAYEAEPNSTAVGSEPANMRKNRYSDVLPYDHSRVVLGTATNVSGSDYINASTITDHDPRNPAYIAAQGPLPHTVADFWQMVWEQGSVVIVNLTKLTEGGVAMCHRYWPEEGSDLYHIYEVHLVSEHIWCEDYVVRSFYLKNLQTNETRTVTQFHFLTWPDLGIPASSKALLDFRRKVNKSYRGRSCPILVHCSDGVGRSGTYALIDMVLNRMSKGAKEIDIAASLEHFRDQRMLVVKTKEQFEFALACVAEEVHAILKALPQ